MTKGWEQGICGAHQEHEAHVRDAGRAEAQRLVELICALPSREGIYEAMREVRGLCGERA